ncbi:hypothetical protein YDYSY3_38040 [Paenibacillus chitinolyticus]|uniref:hypothetical protein n=1 Tax=Paenibacillus chitinolyticus TaxID=79263 RepID=UPI0026E4ABB1|nr:hypothetical protein [Paenibacillus chitinolyticus]GKS12804.1 hypothetical protein YDYSY3_38040 [Paenibacillus chitinolyticus]
MKLETIEIHGFKNLDTCRLSFGMATKIIGDHEKGKTALSEAILWCLKGCDLQGSTKVINKKFKNSQAKEMSVTTHWLIRQPNGEFEKLQFSRVLRGRVTKLFINEKPSLQSEFDAYVGPTDVFLGIFCPGYLGGLPPIRLRNVILSLLTEQDPLQVIQQLSEADQQRLQHLDMSDPLQRLKEKREEASEWETYIQDIRMRIEELSLRQAFIGKPELIEAEHKKLSELRQLLDEVSQQEGPSKDPILSLQKELSQLGTQYRSLEKQWKEIKQASLQDTRQQTALDQIKEECQALLNKGFLLREELQTEEKHYEQNQTDFLIRKEIETQQLQNDITQLEEKHTLRLIHAKLGLDSPRFHEQLKTGIEERDQVEAGIESLHTFMIQYARMQVGAVNDELEHVKLSLQVKRDSGREIILNYSLRCKDQDLFTLSNFEKNTCSLELSNLVNKIRGRFIPVFIDNGESLEPFMNAQTQLFATSVRAKAMLSSKIVLPLKQTPKGLRAGA